MPDTWLDTLPEETRNAIPAEYREDQNFTKYPNMGEFLKGHRNLVDLVGRKGVIVPNEKSTPEEVEAFQIAMGRPKTPDEYKIKIPDGLHERIKVTPESTKKFLQAAHKMGIPNGMAEQLNAWYLKDLSDQFKALDENSAKTKQANQERLMKAWGDKAGENLKATSAFVERIGGKEALTAFGELGDNPDVLMFLHKLSTSLDEGSIARIVGSQHSEGAGTESEGAQKKIKEIQANKAHPFWNENDPKHHDAVMEMTELYKQAFPS